MSEAARSRYALDLDEIERQIREASSRPAAKGQPLEDPLAELARIVSGNGKARTEASTVPSVQSAHYSSGSPRDLSHAVAREFGAPRAPEPVQPAETGLQQDIERLLDRDGSGAKPAAVNYDEFTEAMRSFEQVIADPRVTPVLPAPQPESVAYRPYEPAQPAAAIPEPPVDLNRELSEMIASQTQSHQQPVIAAAGIPEPEPEIYQAYPQAGPAEVPVRSRKKSLMLVAAVVGVAAVGVGGALSFRGKGGIQASGQPPLIKAAEGPSKIAPANPGGAEVPDQNRQILERSAAKTAAAPRVVANDEQPLDLKEAVRKDAAAQSDAGTAAAPRVILSSPLPVPAQPGAGAVEPRKVKTVVIKPPAAAEPATPTLAAPVEPAPPPVRTASIPPKPPEATAPIAPVAAAPVAPAAQAPKPKPKPAAEARPAQPRPAPATPSAASDEPVATGTAPMSIVPSGQPKRSQRLQQQAAVAPSPAVQSDAQPAASGGGGFVVQLSSEGSDAEARSSASRFKSRFGELGDFGTSIQRREVNGQTRYRVRFGSMSRDDANALCSSLKGKGQACIVQPN